MSTEAIAKVIDSYFANMGAMNPDEAVKNFAEDALIYDPVGKPPSKVEDYPKLCEILSMVFDKLEVTKDKVFIAGNGAAVKWSMSATGKNGKVGTAEGISVFDLDDSGKIQQVCSYWDDEAMMAQIRD